MPKPDLGKGKGKVQCAIYTRKSSEEGLDQEFNSLDAQREACEAYIKSQKHAEWHGLPDMYDDGGISGGTMERPALQQLLTDVRSGKVNVIVVYKVDRLTRSLADFAKIVETLDACGASFVSVTQQFNTTTSMGRLTLNVLLSFAQFEREIAGERIRDKIAASKKKGMWMGGTVPLGYDAIDRKLVINAKEADTVRLVFRRYYDLGTVSLLQLDLDRLGIVSKQRTNKNGLCTGGKRFSRGALYLLLKNRLYLGEIVHQGTAYSGLHEPIVDRELWHGAQTKLDNNRAERKLRKGAKQPSLLSGLIVDNAGKPMTPTHAVKKGKRYRYYISRHLNNPDRKDIDNGQRIPAGDIEGLILDRLKTLISSENEIGNALAPFHLDAVGYRSMFSHARKLTKRWQTISAFEIRSLVRATIQKVYVGEDKVQLSIDRPGLFKILKAESLDNQYPAVKDTSKTELEDDQLVLEINTHLARAGKGIRLVIGNGQADEMNPELVNLISEAFAIKDQFLNGCDESIEAMSKRLKVSKGYITSRIRITYLAPDIIRSMLEGQHPVGLSPTKLLATSKDIPHCWAEQYGHLGFPKTDNSSAH